MSLFVFYPVLSALKNSFLSINLLRPDDIKFVGLANYQLLFSDDMVLHAMRNSLCYYILSVSAEIAGGLLIALALRQKSRYRGVLLGIIILPWALPPVVNGVIWKWIFDPSSGLLSDLLLKMGIIQQLHIWWASPNISLSFVTVVHIWKMIPLIALIMLAQLLTIPGELYEAAIIDGANIIQVFWHITLPLLKPALIIALAQGTIYSLQLFDEAYVLTGSALDTRSILLENYLIAFRQLKLSAGMALSLVITIVSIGLCAGYILLGKESERT